MNSFILTCLFLLCILAKRIRDPGFVSPERFLAIESKDMDFLLFLNLVSETPYVALMQAAISSEKLYRYLVISISKIECKFVQYTVYLDILSK